MTLYPNRLGLMVGLPFSGRPLINKWALSFHQLSPPMDYNVEYAMVEGQPVDAARNHIVEQAIAKKAKYIFFIDEDVTGPAHSVRQLIYHMEHFPKVAVAGGIYCHKSPPPMPMVFRGNGGGPFWDWKIGEVFDISGIGMGWTLIRTDVFKDLEKPYFKTIDNASAYLEGINHGELWTEDLYFCDKVTKAGWQIVADGGLLCEHWDANSGKAYTLPPTSKPWRKPGVIKGKKKIVDLGCGPAAQSYTTEEGDVIRVDIREDVEPDYRCDVRRLPFKSAEFDIVFSSHTLEHFCRQEIPEVLDEWTRILKPDGEFRIILPNLEWAAQHILNKEIDKDVMNVLYGAQSYEENFHKMGFTPQIIEQMLAERGFIKFIWDYNNYHMFCRAWKHDPEKIDQVNPIIREITPIKLNGETVSLTEEEVRILQKEKSLKDFTEQREKDTAEVYGHGLHYDSLVETLKDEL